MSHRLLSALALAPLAALLGGALPAAATVPGDLCTGNPCVIDRSATLAPGTALDFGNDVALVLAPAAALTASGGVDGDLQLRAGSIVLQPGALVAGAGATIALQASAGRIELQRSGSSVARVEASANVAGTITLDASDEVVVAGNLEARGTGRDAAAGTIEITAGAALRVDGSVLASATASGAAGGSVSLDGASVTIAGTVSVAGADFGGGEVDLATSAGDLSVIGALDLSGGNPDGSGGTLEIVVQGGALTLAGSVSGTGGSGAQEACGDGAALTIDGGGDVALGGTIDVGAGTHCFGGEITVSAGGEVRQTAGATLRARGPGAFGAAGRLEIEAGTRVVLRDVDLTSPGAGGVLDASAPQAIDVRGLVDASASGGSGVGGAITLQSCTVTVARSATLDARGALPSAGFGQTTLLASGTLSVAGTVRSATGNRFVHRGTLPVVTGTVSPAATVSLDATLPECPRTPACGDHLVDPGEVCDDGNTTSCDGCGASCTRHDAVCGDGIPECGEACDDGNRADGDGCEVDCRRTPPQGVRLRGEPAATAGCLAQWSLQLPAPALDPESGLPVPRQTCRDGDPSCDADGTVDGVCTVPAALCLNVPDPALPACAPGSVKLVTLVRPQPGDGGDAIDRTNREALLAALAALDVKVKHGATLVQRGGRITSADTCTSPTLLQVPHAAGASDERTFRVSAGAPGALAMKRNVLTLVCETAVATCGDGVQQSGEACDDANVESCDGCSASCAVEGCGNGVVECGEECDEGDANGSDDGACSALCARRTPELRIPGGGARRHDCAFEWSALATDSAITLDRHGLPEVVLSCSDGDPACDLDPRAGRCRVRIWGCVGGADQRLGCSARAVTGLTVRSPAATLRRAPEVAARAALLAAFDGIAFPAGPGERCTAPIELDVPVRQSWLDLKVEAALDGTAAADRDALRIRCR